MTVLRVPDVPGSRGEKRNRPLDRRILLQRVLPDHAAEFKQAVVAPDACQRAEAVEVDQRRRAHQAHAQQRDEALPSGQH
jgi:hypothetical protein